MQSRTRCSDGCFSTVLEWDQSGLWKERTNAFYVAPFMTVGDWVTSSEDAKSFFFVVGWWNCSGTCGGMLVSNYYWLRAAPVVFRLKHTDTALKLEWLHVCVCTGWSSSISLSLIPHTLLRNIWPQNVLGELSKLSGIEPGDTNLPHFLVVWLLLHHNHRGEHFVDKLRLNVLLFKWKV